MSLPLFAEDVVFLQRFLKCEGLYAGKIDGIWGPKTDAGARAFEERSDAIAALNGQFDMTSERCIRTLHPRAQEAARQFLRKVLDAGISARVISGTRSYAEQNGLYRRGRFGNPPPQVTKARGGHSNHNFGIAWDIGIFDNGAYRGESPKYAKAAQVGLSPGLEWGGHWTSFKDEPHYQLATPHKVATVRSNFEKGMAYV